MRRHRLVASAVAVPALALAIAGCGSSSSSSSSSAAASASSTTAQSATAPAADKNIVAVAAGAPQFSTLVGLVKKAGLVSALESNGPLTVFAPTNEAFAKLAKDDPALFAKVSKDKALLASVLKYHVVAGSYPASAVVTKKTLTTLDGKPLAISVKNGNAYVDQAQVVTTNIKASNGVVHAINAVLVPPSN